MKIETVFVLHIAIYIVFFFFKKRIMFIIISIINSSFYLNIELILVVNYLKVNLKKILIFCSLATQPILLGTYLVKYGDGIPGDYKK